LSPPPPAGEGQGGGSRRNGSGDGFEYAFAIGHEVIIAEAQNLKTLGLDHGRAPGVCPFRLIRKMLPTIEFDHQPGVVFDNTEPSLNHIHTLVRTPNGNDYGRDLLRAHYERHDHSHPDTPHRRGLE